MATSPYPVPEQVYLYHITHLDNLPAILNSGGLESYSALHASQVEYANLAYGDIQRKRARTNVECDPGGTLHDYVSFYFAARSPMLYAVHCGNVAGHSGGQGTVVHLVTRVADVQEANLPFVFSDGHGIMAFSSFYDAPARLNQVDFPLMGRKYWRDTDEDPDRARRRQAEFLVRDFFPWEAFRGVGVYDAERKAQVDALLDGVRGPQQAHVLPRLYY